MTDRTALWVTAAVLTATSSAQAFIFWTNSSGTGSFFSWSGGGSDHGRFGDPVLVGGNTFVFSPPAFVATSLNGQGAATPDRLEVRLTAFPGQRFTQISVSEHGGWVISGVGTVQDSGTLILTDLVTARAPAFQSLQHSPVMPISSPNSAGNWTGTANINLAGIPGPDWTDLVLVLTNTLQASSQPGTTASITKTELIITIVPAPAVVGPLALGMGLASVRRRRRD